MKLSDMIQGKRAIRRDVRFRPMTAAPRPERAPLGAAPEDILVGVQGLSGAETAEVLQKAEEQARAKGVEKWDETHPMCLLYLKAHTILKAVVAVPQDPEAPLPEKLEPFFDSIDQILNSDLVGRDNIVYLHEQYESWMETSGVRTHHMKPEEVIALVMEEVGRPENERHPLELLGPALLVSSVRFLANQLFISQIFKSGIGSSAEMSSTESSSDGKTSETKPSSNSKEG